MNNQYSSSKLRLTVLSAVAFALLAFSALPVAAQSGEGDKKALVERIVKSQQGAEFDRLLVQLASSGNQNLVAQLAPRFDGLPDAKKEAARAQLNQALQAYVAEINALLKQRAGAVVSKVLVPLYEERFSAEELRTLVTFFESDVNRKYQGVAAEFGQKVVQAIVQDAQKQVEEKAVAFLKKGDEILVSNGAPAAAAPTVAPRPAAAPRPATSAKK